MSSKKRCKATTSSAHTLPSQQGKAELRHDVTFLIMIMVSALTQARFRPANPNFRNRKIAL